MMNNQPLCAIYILLFLFFFTIPNFFIFFWMIHDFAFVLEYQSLFKLTILSEKLSILSNTFFLHHVSIWLHSVKLQQAEIIKRFVILFNKLSRTKQWKNNGYCPLWTGNWHQLCVCGACFLDCEVLPFSHTFWSEYSTLDVRWNCCTVLPQDTYSTTAPWNTFIDREESTVKIITIKFYSKH